MGGLAYFSWFKINKRKLGGVAYLVVSFDPE
jgi:hypothetical protein